MTCLDPQQAGLGGRKSKNLCLVTVSHGLLCPFELARRGGVCVGTNVVSWAQKSRVDIRGREEHHWAWKALSSSPRAGGFLLPLLLSLSASFSCRSLQICFLCLFMAFLLPPKLALTLVMATVQLQPQHP